MTEYLKRVHRTQSELDEYYHWNADCHDIPQRGREAVLIFQTKPLNYEPCQKCTQIDIDKKAKKAKAKAAH